MEKYLSRGIHHQQMDRTMTPSLRMHDPSRCLARHPVPFVHHIE